VRESLSLQNIQMPNPAARLAWLAENLRELPGSGIIYTLTVRDAERVTEWLKLKGFAVAGYHSQLQEEGDEPVGGSLREELEQKLLRNEVKALVATVALGMGFDKPDIGFVIHYQRPSSVVHYYQQVGRAGRAVDHAFGILFGGEEDDQIADYKLDQALIDALMSLRLSEQQQMRDYMRTKTCLMQFLEQALDDPAIQPCGKCAVCRQAPLFRETYSSELASEATVFLRRSFQVIVPRKQWPPSFSFEHYSDFKGRITEGLSMQEGRALSLFNDPGWGHFVRDGKYCKGHFSDELIDGCKQMIAAWNPQPAPVWITCVPSNRHPELVPSFACRLATALGIPFSPCVLKVRENAPQKEMNNSGQQAANLDGVFSIESTLLLPGSVFLLDDMTDSKWTFTVIAALLRQVGVEAVFPMALALNSPRMD